MRTKVLLLNPPGRQLYIRDYYCSKVSKAGYLVEPVDLLMLSGRLAERFDLHVLDALAEGMGADACLDRIERLAPDVVIAVSGAVSFAEDRGFLARLARPGRRIVVSGDIVLSGTEAWLEQQPFVDAALLDFTGGDIVPYVAGENGPFRDLVTRGESGAPAERKRPVNAEYLLPVPRHDLFLYRRYRFPFSRRRRFATVLTDYGCPYACSFCVMSTIGYQYRTVDSVMEELRLVRSLGIRELYFSDQTFGAMKERTLDLCDRMRRERLAFGWTCFSRVDLVTDELLGAMQAAGCHTVMLGVESASSDILLNYRKGITPDQVREAFRRCRARKIRTVGTFILGLPEETEESARATMALARELDCDFASFNIAVPRMGTGLRRQAIGEGLIGPDLVAMDQTGSTIAMPTRHLTREQLERIRAEAIRGFYLRPGYLWRRLRGVTTLHELREQAGEGWELLRGLGKRGAGERETGSGRH